MITRLAAIAAVLLVPTVPAFGGFGIQAIDGFTEASPAIGSDLTSGELEGAKPFLIWEGVATPSGPLFVDHDGSDGEFNSFSPPNDVSPATLAAGVAYGSYLVHFDPANNSTATASVTFNGNTRIVGIIFDNSNGVKSLNASDSVFNVINDYEFNTQAGRGLDFGSAIGDGFVISDDGRTLSFVASDFDLQITGGGIDEMRIIVQAVPEMSAILSWVALAGIGCVAYRRYRR